MRHPTAWRGCERLAKAVQGPACAQREVRRTLSRVLELCKAAQVPDGGLWGVKTASKHVSVLFMHMGCCDAMSNARLTLFSGDDVAYMIVYYTQLCRSRLLFAKTKSYSSAGFSIP